MKGFRDLYPEDKRRQNYMFLAWKFVAEKYGFDEIAGPVLESVDLYKKSGAEIPEQMYVFFDKSGRKVALRPELTPTIARMVSGRSLLKPVKWYSIADCYRYEAKQLGRGREFTQLNLDILGTKSMKADAEMISATVDLMKTFGLSKKDFFVGISNRKLLDSLLNSIGVRKLKDVYRLIDKKNKISDKAFRSSLNLNEKQIKDLVKILNIKDLEKIKIESIGLDELKELFSYLKSYKVLDYCKLDLSIIRGLDYYNSNVFEVFDSKRKFRAIAGGGRYVLEGLDAVGMAMGDIVLELFLDSKKKLEKLFRRIDFYIAPVNDKVYSKAIKVADKLRQKGNIVEIDLLGRNLGKQFNYANSRNASFVVIVGERDKGKVTIRDMKTGKEKKVKI